MFSRLSAARGSVKPWFEEGVKVERRHAAICPRRMHGDVVPARQHGFANAWSQDERLSMCAALSASNIMVSILFAGMCVTRITVFNLSDNVRPF